MKMKKLYIKPWIMAREIDCSDLLEISRPFEDDGMVYEENHKSWYSVGQSEADRGDFEWAKGNNSTGSHSVWDD